MARIEACTSLSGSIQSQPRGCHNTDRSTRSISVTVIEDSPARLAIASHSRNTRRTNASTNHCWSDRQLSRSWTEPALRDE